jgi:hypothetical protein
MGGTKLEIVMKFTPLRTIGAIKECRVFYYSVKHHTLQILSGWNHFILKTSCSEIWVWSQISVLFLILLFYSPCACCLHFYLISLSHTSFQSSSLESYCGFSLNPIHCQRIEWGTYSFLIITYPLHFMPFNLFCPNSCCFS